MQELHRLANFANRRGSSSSDCRLLHRIASPVRQRGNVRCGGPVSGANRQERRGMSENVGKVNEGSAPRGEMGQRHLASGESVSMRLWDGEEPGDPKPEAARPYETVGYVIGGDRKSVV